MTGPLLPGTAGQRAEMVPEPAGPAVASARMLVVALCFSAGLLAADRIGAGRSPALAAGLLGLVLLLGVWLLHRRSPAPARGELLPSLSRRAVALLVAGLAMTGFADLALRARPPPAGAGRAVWVEGVVAGDPAVSGRTTLFTVRARAIAGRPSRTRVAVRAFGPAAPVRLGYRVGFRAAISPLDPRDPFDARLRRRWVDARATTPAAAIRVRGHPSNPLLRAAGAFRERMAVAARRSLPPADAGLLLGLTIGDESGIPDRVREDFRAAGLSHLTAVSGANVAVVAGATVAVLAAARVPRRFQVGAAMAVLGLFALVTRWEPSVLRATVMAWVALGAYAFGRRADPLHGLGLAATGLLAADPYLLWEPGFQLSCAATAGILLVAPPVAARLRRWPRALAQAGAVAVAAQLAVLPLVIVHFRRVSLVGIPANVAVLPLVGPAMVVGLAGGVVALASPMAATPLMWLAGMPAMVLRHLAAWAASLPYASVAFPPAALAPVAAVVLAAAAVARLRHRAVEPARAGPRQSRAGPRGLRRRPAALLLVVALAAGAGGLALFRPPAPPPGLRVTFFDVGQGEAALLESPGGALVLVDGGPDPEAVASRLVRRGIRRLDLVVFSHEHADHVAGLPAVLRRIRVRAAIAPVPLHHPVRSQPSSLLRQAMDGDRFRAGDLVADVIGPSPGLRDAALTTSPADGSEGSAVNNASLVLRVSWGRGCLLFTGDIEEEAQRELLDRHRAAVDCTVLKAPHHGSAKLLPAFVQAVDPELVAVSAGRNTYGHPSASALAMFGYVGATVLRTDQRGDLVLEMDRAGRARAW